MASRWLFCSGALRQNVLQHGNFLVLQISFNKGHGIETRQGTFHNRTRIRVDAADVHNRRCPKDHRQRNQHYAGQRNFLADRHRFHVFPLTEYCFQPVDFLAGKYLIDVKQDFYFVLDLGHAKNIGGGDIRAKIGSVFYFARGHREHLGNFVHYDSHRQKRLFRLSPGQR